MSGELGVSCRIRESHSTRPRTADPGFRSVCRTAPSWLNLRLLDELYPVSMRTISEHIINIYSDMNSALMQLSGNSE